MTETMIAVEGLEVRYGKTVALAGVSLEVEAGSVFALLGRNGAGKSSLVRCLLGHRQPSAGPSRPFRPRQLAPSPPLDGASGGGSRGARRAAVDDRSAARPASRAGSIRVGTKKATPLG